MGKKRKLKDPRGKKGRAAFNKWLEKASAAATDKEIKEFRKTKKKKSGQDSALLGFGKDGGHAGHGSTKGA